MPNFISPNEIRSLKGLKDQKLLDFHSLAQERLSKYRDYSRELNNVAYDNVIERLEYCWGRISIVYEKITSFEQESYKIIPANLRNQNNEFWHLKDRHFYLSLKIFTTVLNIGEKEILVAFPPLHEHKDGGRRYKSPIKFFSKKTDFIIYLIR